MVHAETDSTTTSSSHYTLLLLEACRTREMMVGNAFVAIFLASLAGTHAFVNLTPLNPSCSRTSPAAFKMTMDAAESVTRSEAIQRAAVGSGVLAAGVLLAPLRQGEAGAEELKDESEQFGELRGNLEKKGKLEQVRDSAPHTGRAFTRCLFSATCITVAGVE